MKGVAQREPVRVYNGSISIEVMKEGGLVISEEEFNKWHGANKIEAIRHFAQQQKPEVNILC